MDKKNGFSFELPPGWKNLTHAQLVEKFDRIAQDDPQDAKAINAVPTGISDFAQTTLDGPGFEPNVFVTVTEKTVTIGATISAAKSYYSAAFSSETNPYSGWQGSGDERRSPLGSGFVRLCDDLPILHGNKSFGVVVSSDSQSTSWNEAAFMISTWRWQGQPKVQTKHE